MRQFKGIMKYRIWVGVAMIGISSMSGCGSSNKTASSVPYYEVTESAEAYDVVSEQEGITSESSEMKGDVDLPSQEEAIFSSSDTPMINTETGYNRKIIKNGEMTIQTKALKKTTQDMIDYLQKLGGYIEEMTIEGANFYNKGNRLRMASLKIRIPQKQFDTFINKGGDFGVVASLTCSTQDVTSSYVDAEIRIQTLQTRYDRLMAFMEKSGDLTELFKLEKEISNVSYEIEQYKGTLNQYDSLVDMGTLTVQIEEVKEEIAEEVPESFILKVQKTFRTSLDGILSFLQGIVIVLVGVMPTLIIFIPVGLLVWRVIKKYLNRSMNNSNRDKNKGNDDEEMKDN